MAQKKAPDKSKFLATPKKSHDRLEKQFFLHLLQESRTNGGDDLLKKMKSMRAITASDLDILKKAPMDVQFKKTSPCKKSSSSSIRNYMKPTSCSDARKEMLQVKVHPRATGDWERSSRISKNSGYFKESFCSLSSGIPKPFKALMPSKKSSGMALCTKKKMQRATCSSTLRNLKFPAALELNLGATEAEGTSKMRVCPYTYCSLNGHMHEPLPPLKSFISARRKLLKTQKSMTRKCLSSFKTKGFGKEIDDVRGNGTGEGSSDFLVEIYTMPQEEIIGENSCDKLSISEHENGACFCGDVKDARKTFCQINESYSVTSFEDDMNQGSELSYEEIAVSMVNNLEFVEFDHGGGTQEDIESQVDDGIKKSFCEATNMDWEEEKRSEDHSDDFSSNPAFEATKDELVDEIVPGNSRIDDKEENGKGDSLAIEEEDSLRSNKEKSALISQSIDAKQTPEENALELTLNQVDDDKQSDESNVQYICEEPEKEQQDELTAVEENIKKVSATDIKEMEDNMQIMSDIDEFNILSRRWNNTRKRTIEELEQIKEFNPREPCFLPLEPDPEAEKVDLRHQMMDERKNAEEWMLDYALQQTLTKLGPARKRKVSLLVEAFETVNPLPTYEKHHHETTSFTHPKPIQACI